MFLLNSASLGMKRLNQITLPLVCGILLFCGCTKSPEGATKAKKMEDETANDTSKPKQPTQVKRPDPPNPGESKMPLAEKDTQEETKKEETTKPTQVSKSDLPEWLQEKIGTKSVPGVTYLRLTSTEVKDHSALVNLPNLKRLIVETDAIPQLPTLESVQVVLLTSRNASDLSQLAKLPNLEQLECVSTQVSDLTPLRNLVKLRRLDIAKTQVADFSPLAGLSELTVYPRLRYQGQRHRSTGRIGQTSGPASQ